MDSLWFGDINPTQSFSEQFDGRAAEQVAPFLSPKKYRLYRHPDDTISTWHDHPAHEPSIPNTYISPSDTTNIYYHIRYKHADQECNICKAARIAKTPIDKQIDHIQSITNDITFKHLQDHIAFWSSSFWTIMWNDMKNRNLSPPDKFKIYSQLIHLLSSNYNNNISTTITSIIATHQYTIGIISNSLESTTQQSLDLILAIQAAQTIPP